MSDEIRPVDEHTLLLRAILDKLTDIHEYAVWANTPRRYIPVAT